MFDFRSDATGPRDPHEHGLVSDTRCGTGSRGAGDVDHCAHYAQPALQDGDEIGSENDEILPVLSGGSMGSWMWQKRGMSRADS